MRLFVYGTLCDQDVRNLVLGDNRRTVTPAILRGYITTNVFGSTYPALRSRPTASVSGLVLSDLEFSTLLRISHYEGDEYQLVQRQPMVSDQGPVEASLFCIRKELLSGHRPWILSEWQYRYKLLSLKKIDVWMERWHPNNPNDVRRLAVQMSANRRGGRL